MRLTTLDELRSEFGSSSARREALFERLEEWLQIAAGTGQLRRVLLFGSFCTAKDYPGDLDILAIFAAGFDAAILPRELLAWFDHELCHQVHEIDLFYLTESLDTATMDLVMDTFRYNRAGEETMIEVQL
jgi:hypothetical protein